MPKQSTYSTFTPILSDYLSATDDPGGTPVHGNVTLTSLRDLLQANLTKATITAAANAEAVVSTGYSLTGSNAQSLIDLSGTWNTTGTPTAIKLNVTDTASNAASKLLDLQVGGSSKFRVDKNGSVLVSRTGANYPYYVVDTGSAYTGLVEVDLNTLKIVVNEAASSAGAAQFRFSSSTYGMWVRTGIALGSTASSPDVYLYRDAANTLALRNGANGQKQNTYGTYTDASNYRRLEIAMTTAGVASIAPAGAGTGASGNVLHISGLPTSNPGPGILWNNGGTPAIGT